MTDPGFTDARGLEQVAVNLFYGWGYNFYRLENLLRADDLLVRQKAGSLLAEARAAIEAAESAYRRVALPPPSRAKPRPDAAAVALAQTLERLSQALGALEGQVRSQPVPETDRMTQWYREEATTLARLRDGDLDLVSRAEAVRALVSGRDGAWLIENAPRLGESLSAIAETLRERATTLTGRA